MSIRMACCIGLAIVGTTVVPATMAATTKSIDVQLYSPMLLADFSKSLGLSEKDGLEKGLSLPTAHGTESVRLQQVYDKAPVFGHGLVIEIDKQGRVLKASGNLALGLNDDLSGRLPTLSADAAWQALPHKDSDPKARDYQAMVVRAQTGPAAVDKADALDLDDSRLLVPAKLGILPGLLESKWVYRVVFDYPQQRRMFRALIDARDGSVVRVNDDTLHDGIGAAKQKVVSSRSEVKPATVEVDEFTIPVQIQGPGGNLKTGPYTYGGDRPALVGLSDVTGTRCTLRNPRVATRVYSETIAEGVPWVFPCTVSDGDAVNGAYSPNNDAHNFVEDTLQMYLAYMRVPAFTQQIVVLSHSTRNGLWVPPNIVQLGDGDEKDFPSAVLDVVGHELGHGIFIDNNVDAVNAFDGIYDTFPDMVGTAAKWYRRGHEDFLIGLEMRKGDGEFHRNMCKADVPPNPANGVYNQVFCKLSKVLGTAIAFQIFGRANLLYWNDPLDYGTTSYCGGEGSAGYWCATGSGDSSV